MDTHTQIGAIIDFLEQIRRRPAAWIGTEAQNILPFLHGFTAACKALGIVQEGIQRNRIDAFNAIVTERGWEVTAFHPVAQMLEQQLTYQQIVDEALVMEILLWKRLYSFDETE